MELPNLSLTMLDASLLYTFVERWHLETSSFQLPFGEMIITLDDVYVLFHIPIGGRFFIDLVINHITTLLQVVKDFQVPEDVVQAKFEFNKGLHLQMSWLRDMYHELVEA